MGNAVFFDLDNNGPVETTERLLMLGAPRDALAAGHFRHCEPEDAADLMRYVQDCAGWADLAIIDNVGELLPLFGGNSDKADDYTRVVGQVTKPLIAGGAGVVLLDHLAKGHESRAYGSGGTMAKRRAISGVSLEVRPLRQFVPGEGGSAELVINKDRPGGLRRHCPPGRGRRQNAGTFVLEPPGAAGEPGPWHIAPATARTAATFDEQCAGYLRAAAGLGRSFTVEDLAVAVGAEVPPTQAQREMARWNIDKLTEDGALRVVREGRKGRGGAGLWEVAA